MSTDADPRAAYDAAYARLRAACAELASKLSPEEQDQLVALLRDGAEKNRRAAAQIREAGA